MMVVHVRDSSDGILEMFRSAAVAAGLQCHQLGLPLLDGWKNPGVQCKPNADRNLGLVNVFDVKESKSVVPIKVMIALGLIFGRLQRVAARDMGALQCIGVQEYRCAQVGLSAVNAIGQ
jgi:hypothetical protein